MPADKLQPASARRDGNDDYQHSGKDSPVRTDGDSIEKPKPVFPVSIPIDDHTPFPATYRNMIKAIIHLDA